MKIKDIITLDDNNKYIISSKIHYEGNTYYYLVDINNPENLMFCYEKNGYLVELNDKELTTRLLPLFYEAAKDSL